MGNPKLEIKLESTAQGIMAHWLVDGKPDQSVVDLFNTHIIPTPYINAEYMRDAIREIERRNPGYVVSAI